MGDQAQGKVGEWEMPLRLDQSIRGCTHTAGNAGITGRQGGWSLLLLGKHLSIISCGWESGGGEQSCSLAERSFPPAGPGSSLRLSCSRGWITPAWHTGFFYFPDEKASLDLKHL